MASKKKITKGADRAASHVTQRVEKSAEPEKSSSIDTFQSAKNGGHDELLPSLPEGSVDLAFVDENPQDHNGVSRPIRTKVPRNEHVE